MLAITTAPTITLKKLVKSSSPTRRSFDKERPTYKAELAAFLAKYPVYKETEVLDRLRKVEFARLDKAKEVYVDYMGGCLWPKSIVSGHAALLEGGLFGNTHSDSPCATRSDQHISAARNAVLDFFDAPVSDYVCIFTANATTALKIVGESFPFSSESRLIIPADCHNSVNGIRSFAEDAGATVNYLASMPTGGFERAGAIALLDEHRSESHSSSLFIVTGQSNITGIRPNLSILEDAKSAGFSTLIDAAALASSMRISLQQTPVADAMVVSFYKMFGYPTGVGALIAKKSFLATLGRKWFSGGTVDFVQAPGKLTLHAQDLTSRFEEGTLNYSSLSAIAPGLKFLGIYMPFMSLRLPSLHHHLHTALDSLVYPNTEQHLVKVHTKLRDMPLERTSSMSSDSSRDDKGRLERKMTIPPSSPISPRSFKRFFSRQGSSMLPTLPTSPIEEQPSSIPISSSGDAADGQGYVVSCTFYTSEGTIIPLSQVSRLASANGISLRTGCVCNPGGSVALRGRDVQDRMDELSKFEQEGGGVELKQVCTLMGGMSNAGVVRLSLGMASNYEDVWKVLNWAKGLLDEVKREADLARLAATPKAH